VSESTTVCNRCVLTGAFPGISFDENGVCSECHEYERRWGRWESELPKRKAILKNLCEDARSKRRHFDALVPLSGGKDSTYVLYQAVNNLGLHCLAVTFDNGYLSEHARGNIDRVCRLLGVEHIYYRLDPVLMNRLYALFMRKTGTFCSVCMCGIGMATERIAEMYDFPLILRGSSARTELVLSPEDFADGSVDYVRNVLRGEPIAAECNRLLYRPSLRRRIGYRLFRWEGRKRIRLCATIDLPDYSGWEYETIYRTNIEKIGWRAPSEDMEHIDCVIHPVTTYLQNRRFPGREIRRLTLARLIMAGQVSREEAMRQLDEEPNDDPPEPIMAMFLQNLGMTRKEFDRYVDMGPRHLQFKRD